MNGDFVIIDEDTETKEDVEGFMYYDLFMKMGEKKSKKMIHYLFAKIIAYGSDWENEERGKHMDKLKIMKPHYKRAFNKDFI